MTSRRAARAIRRLAAGAVTTAVCAAGLSLPAGGQGRTGAPQQPRAPGAGAPAPRPVCGDRSLLAGPPQPPRGAVTVAAGDDAHRTLDKPDTVYWFAPGDHTFGSGKFGQIVPGDHDTYVGAPGAVLDGEGVNLYAFTQHADDVTIEHLKIEHFGTLGSNQTQGVVNHTSAHGWVIEDDTVQDNGGAGVMLGSGDVLRDNCLEDNGQYGFSSYSTTGAVAGLTVSGNEVVGNDAHRWAVVDPGCGCSGGAKFWDTRDAVVTDNYVHGNHNVGLWVDTDNAGFDIADNTITHNWAEGLIYEVSYNGRIVDNTLDDNAWGEGRTLDFPDSAIYVSESGGDARVKSRYSGTLRIADNLFVNNWGGVVLWENANRFCSDGSDGLCTLVDPAVDSKAACHAHLAGVTVRRETGYSANCRWRTQNVTVADNTFRFDPRVIGPSCTVAHHCGYNGLFSNYGTPPYKGWVVPVSISDGQHDVFRDNRYEGPWRFDGFALGDRLSWRRWRAGAPEPSGHRFDGQDGGSTFHA
jgi:hypothetical protein